MGTKTAPKAPAAKKAAKAPKKAAAAATTTVQVETWGTMKTLDNGGRVWFGKADRTTKDVTAICTNPKGERGAIVQAMRGDKTVGKPATFATIRKAHQETLKAGAKWAGLEGK